MNQLYTGRIKTPYQEYILLEGKRRKYMLRAPPLPLITPGLWQ